MIYLLKDIPENIMPKLIKPIELPGIGTLTCSDLGGHNNCTLTALYNILQYYRNQGYDSVIPADKNILYGEIRKQAELHGYQYSRGRGLSVLKNSRFVTDTLRALGFTDGKGKSRYLLTRRAVLRELDQGRPCILSFASGKYYDHTVTVYGYRIYRDEETGKTYTTLLLRDGWSKEPQELPWCHMGRLYLTCMTTIEPMIKLMVNV